MSHDIVLAPQRKMTPPPQFRRGTDYYVIWQEGHRRPIRRETLVRRVARLVRKSQRLVMYDLYVLMNAAHRRNQGRCHADLVARQQGKVLLVPGA